MMFKMKPMWGVIKRAFFLFSGNSFVILVFYKFKNLRTVTNYYVISLSTADLLVGK